MKSPVIVFVLVLGLLESVWLGVANPFNLFVRRSDRFSIRDFRSIRPGTDIADAIERLGKPIMITHSEHDLGCRQCQAYYFLGDPPQWLLSYQEAWLLVDHGRVVAVTVNREP